MAFMHNNKIKLFLLAILMLNTTLLASLYFERPSSAQQTGINSVNPNGSEGVSEEKKLTNFKPPSIARELTSPNPPSLNSTEKEENEAKLERTLPKIAVPTVNQTYEKIPNNTSSEIINPGPNQQDFTINTSSSISHPSLYRIASPLVHSDEIRDFIIYKNKTILPPNGNDSIFSVRLEPSGATDGNIFFVTGNFFTARSTDGGTKWDFNDGEIKCCDQDVIFDKNHKIFIYYLQGDWNNDFSENNFTLSISTDAKKWSSYVISPHTVLGSTLGKNKWFDFPILSLTDKYLYIATDVMNENGSFDQAIILRISLDDLANLSPNPSFKYFYSQKTMNFAPVQGATNTMYFAGHLSNSKMVIYKWTDTEDDPPERFIQNVLPWKIQVNDYQCPMKDNSFNYCGNSLDKIMAGWIQPNGIIGFFWNVDKNEEAGFPWPYVEAATFDTTKNMIYVGRPLIWSKDFAYQYAFVSPDSKGNLGVIASFGGNNYNPSTAVAISSLGDSPPPWKFTPIVNGGRLNQGSNEWGDFLRIRPFYNATLDNTSSAFISFPYSINIVNGAEHAIPYLVIFGK